MPFGYPSSPIFKSHLKDLKLKSVWAKYSEDRTLESILTVVHMKQMFGTDNYYIQDEGCGHEILSVPFGL